MKAIILAAGRGSRMGSLTEEKPKCLTVVKEKPLVEHQISALNEAGIKEIAIVTGYKAECLKKYGTKHFHNPDWEKTNMVYSLFCAQEWLESDDCIVSYSDIFYSPKIVRDLISCPDDIAVAYDPNWLELWSKRFEDPLDDAETFRIDDKGYITEIGQKAQTVEEIQGQYMGLLKIKNGFVDMKYSENNKVDFTTYIRKNFLQKKVKAIPNNEEWFEFDSAADLLAI